VFSPSSEQQAFFSSLATTSDNIILEASAGSGKTTTIVEATRRLRPGTRCKFLAFNKNIQTELEGRLPSGVVCRTFHSDGLNALGRLVGASPLSSKTKRARIDGQKVRTICRDVLSPPSFRLLASPVGKLVGYAKASGLGTSAMEDTDDNWHWLLSHFSVQLDDGVTEAAVINWAKCVLAESNNRRDLLDFDDMLYLPLLTGAPFEPFDIIFIDEAQDTNAVQRALLERMLSPNSAAICTNPPRLIAVGDPQQAIYGFRGADADAMTSLRETFSMRTLPLSVSYRCSRAVVLEAQRGI
jgi:superfamily I DNA/RNA helicase